MEYILFKKRTVEVRKMRVGSEALIEIIGQKSPPFGFHK